MGGTSPCRGAEFNIVSGYAPTDVPKEACWRRIAALKCPTLENIPLIKAAVGVQTQHVPVIEAKRLKLPHPPVQGSAGPNGRGFRRHPQAAWHYRGGLVLSCPAWTSDFNPPRTATSLLAATPTCVGNPPPPACVDSITAGGPSSPEIRSYRAASAPFYFAPIEVSRVVPDRSVHGPTSRESSRLQPTLCLPPANAEAPELVPHRSSSVFSSRANFSSNPEGWILALASCRHSSSSTPSFTSVLLSSSPILNLLPSYPCPPYSRPSPSLSVSRYHPHGTSQKCADRGCWATLAYY